MSKRSAISGALILALVGAMLASPLRTMVGGRGDEILSWAILGMVIFGALNAIFYTVLPIASMMAVASVIVTLLWPTVFAGWTTLFIVLIWPIAMFAGREAQAADAHPVVPMEPHTRAGDRARVGTAALIAACVVAAVIYRLLVHHSLDQSAALFIGVPTLLALMVVFVVTPRSAVGVACKAMTIGLLLAMLFLWEGALCVVMSAPLFYGLAVLIGTAVNTIRGRKTRTQSVISCVALIALVPISMEGVSDTLSFNRDEWVTRTALVHAPADAVAAAILQPPRFNRTLPPYLRVGFPRPTATRLERSAAGTRLIITMTGGEMLLNGMEHRVGALTLDVDEARPGLIRFRAAGDDSHMTHFLLWREAEVQWESTSPDTTKVTWTLRYRRGLDPAWYFGPWERYAAGLAADYLIQSVATP